jgi:cell division transport system permease protein
MTMLNNLKRINKSGFINFWRNGWVSVATILVMVITLFVIGSVIFLNVLLTSSLERIQDKVDINVYFKTDAPEEKIISLKDALSRLSEIKSVEYISRADALRNFKSRHQNNALIHQSLKELDDNPLGAVLNVKAEDPSHYVSISKFLETNSFNEIIDKVNYYQNKIVIDRLANILTASKKAGVGITIIMIVIAVLVAFNTIRLAIFTNRDEISVMRLVGASNNFIRGPFIIEGILHGIIASVLTILIFYPLTLWLAPKIDRFFGGPNIYNYFTSNFLEFFGILLGVSIALGVFSSIIAVRRYLKV